MDSSRCYFLCSSHLLRYAIGDKPLRLEVLFIVNIFIVILSIIATGY